MKWLLIIWLASLSSQGQKTGEFKEVMVMAHFKTQDECEMFVQANLALSPSEHFACVQDVLP